MIKEIAYQGYSVVPSDYESADGQMAASLNLIHEEGAMRPVFQPQELVHFDFSDKYQVVFIHKTADYTHYIITHHEALSGGRQGYVLYMLDSTAISSAVQLPLYINSDNKSTYLTSFGATVDGTGPNYIYRISAVGNTLVVLSEDGLHYFLWKGSEYKALGQNPPMLNIQFGTSAMKPADYDVLNEDMEGHSPYAAWKQSNDKIVDNVTLSYPNRINFNDNYQTQLTEAAWALINKANATITEDKHFYAPFFVRYCYRLYDGSMVMHSAPVFMPLSMKSTFRVEVISAYVDENNQIGVIVEPGAGDPPITVHCGNGGGDIERLGDELYNTTLRYRPANVALTYKCISSEVEALRADWRDIVESVDIFVSLPILRENDSKKIETATQNTFPFHYANNTASEEPWANFTYNSYYYYCSVICDIPMLTDEEYLDKIKSTGTFYKLHSYDFDDDNGIIADGDFHEVTVDTGVMESLAAQEVMTDDYKTHNTFYPLKDSNGNCLTSIIPYNNRLNIAAFRDKLFNGFGMQYLTPHLTTESTTIYLYRIAVTIDTSEDYKDVVYSYDVSSPLAIKNLFIADNPLFYPDNRAIRMKLYWKQAPRQSNYYETIIEMKECPMLNGAYTTASLIDTLTPSLPISAVVTSLPQTTDQFESEGNKLYTSEVNNPFYFPVTGINTVGSGTIIGLSSAAKPLSEGQFGQFPLYAFTTDGVWALEVSSTGGFSARQPITRDVCISPDGITQLDSTVLFATDRGIMLIEGNVARCITDVIASEHPFDVLELPHASVLHTMLGHNTDTCLPTKPFGNFLHGCRMIYDYVHQRVIVFNPSLTTLTTPIYTYAYVYSLKSGLWGMMYNNLATTLNSYPDAMAMSHDNYLVTFSKLNTTAESPNCLFITRPIKLGNPDVLKSIHTVIQRGMCQRGDVNTVLWGSRDLYNWYLIGSSTDNAIRNLRGTPYKYFRIGGVATLTDGKSLFGVSVEAEPRHTSVMQ